VVTVDFQRLNLKPGNRILDIGCGSGRHTAAAYQCPDATVIGADLRSPDVLEAKKRLEFHDACRIHGGGCWALCITDIVHLPFEDNTFDCVICSEVLEHIQEDRNAVGEIIRVLKPGGTLAVSVPRYFPEKICWMLSEAYHQSEGGHLRIYKKDELVRLLEKQGTRYCSGHFAHSLHTPYWWLKCLVGPECQTVSIVNGYHRFLTWDILANPRITRWLDGLLNPIFGKSLVVYCRKK
jgi:SAM-dependent methyltransferase